MAPRAESVPIRRRRRFKLVSYAPLSAGMQAESGVSASYRSIQQESLRLSFLHDAWLAIETYFHQYGLVTLFFVIYFESLGVPLPGESALVSASLLASGQDLAIADVCLAVWVAAVLGDFTGYLIGRFGGRPILERYGWMVKLTPDRLHKLEEVFRARGVIIVVTARFFVILRQLNGLVAGSMDMPWLRFVLANMVGAALWVAVWGLGPYFFGDFVGHWFGALRQML
jgi:membrane protein DedA with SNARE-associated domain